MALSYFTLAELRALPDMSDSTKYTDARCTAVGEFVESRIEEFTKTSFVARTVTDETHDGGGYEIVLHKPYVQSVTSATEDGEAVTDTLTARSGILRRYSAGATTPSLWTAGTENVTVTYQAGYSSTPPADIKEAALMWTRDRLMRTHSQSGVDERRTSMTNEFGNVNFTIAGKDSPSGIPDVDAVLLNYRDRNSFGFA